MVKLCDDMPLIEQARIVRGCGLGTQFGRPPHDIAQRLRQIYRRGRPNPAFNCGASSSVEGDSDYREILILQLLVDALPDWQIEAVSSPGSPRHQ